MKNKKYNILIVDDERFYINVLNELLIDDYNISVAKNGKQALTRLQDVKPDLILLDILMPEMNGYEVCEKLKNDPETKDIPVIFLTVKNDMDDEIQGFELGAADYITKPMSRSIVKARVATHLKLACAMKQLGCQNEVLEEAVRERTKDIASARDVAVYCLGALAEMRDVLTESHLRRTQQYVKLLASKLQDKGLYPEYLTDSYIKLLFKTAPLHDIGKVNVPDNVLLNNGPLSPEDRLIMQKHTEYGKQGIERAERELGSSDFLKIAKEIVYSHHEHWDGSGYPKGLKHEDIPLAGRLMAIADVYDALIVERPYKKPLDHTDALQIIKSASGSQFDPNIVDVFLEVEDDINKTVNRYPSTHCLID